MVATWRRSLIQTAKNLAIGWNYHAFSKLDESQLQFLSPEILSKLPTTVKKTLSQKLVTKLDYSQAHALLDDSLDGSTDREKEIPFADINIFGLQDLKTANESLKPFTEGTIPDQSNVLHSRIIYLYSGASQTRNFLTMFLLLFLHYF